MTSPDQESTSPPLMDPSKSPTENELIAVLKTLYRRYSISLGIDGDKPMSYPDATMADFVTWCREEQEPFTSKPELCARLSVRPVAIDAINELICGSDFAVAGVLFPIWPLLVLQHRPPLKHGVQAVSVSVGMMFFDGKALQVKGVVQFEPAKPLTDGFLCAFIQDQVNQMVNTFAMEGVDRLHDTHGVDISENAEQVQQIQRPMPKPPPGRMGFKGG